MFLKDQVCFVISWHFYILSLIVLSLFSICSFVKDFGHVDQWFIIRYGKDIGSQWTIVDYECNVHNVTYNVDIHTPMITQGLNDLRSFYVAKSDKYVGNCSFQIHFSRHSSDSKIQDNFLNNIAIRHLLTMSKLIHFWVKLLRYYCQVNHLVKYFSLLYFYFFNFYLNVLLISNIFSHYVCRIWKKTLRFIFATMDFQLLCSTNQGMKSNVTWS